MTKARTLTARGMAAAACASTNQSIVHYNTKSDWKEIKNEVQQKRIEEIMIKNIFKNKLDEFKLDDKGIFDKFTLADKGILDDNAIAQALNDKGIFDDKVIDNYLKHLSNPKKIINRQSIKKYEDLYEAVIRNRSTNLGEELQNYSGMFEKDCLELFKTNIKAALIKIKNTEDPKPQPTGYKEIHEALKLTAGGADLKELLKNIGVDTTQAGKIIDTIQNISVIELPTEQLTVLLIIICRANGFIGLTIRKLADFINLFDEKPAANKDRAKNIFIRLFSFCINDNPSDYNNSKELFRKISNIKETSEEITIPHGFEQLIKDLMICSNYSAEEQSLGVSPVYNDSKNTLSYYNKYNNRLLEKTLIEIKDLLSINKSQINTILSENNFTKLLDESALVTSWCTKCQEKIQESSTSSRSSRSNAKIKITKLYQSKTDFGNYIKYFILF